LTHHAPFEPPQRCKSEKRCESGEHRRIVESESEDDPKRAVNHSEAAVVSPATLKNPCLKITPAQRKPMPVMTARITRLGLALKF
jgi:hypothetical protein